MCIIGGSLPGADGGWGGLSRPGLSVHHPLALAPCSGTLAATGLWIGLVVGLCHPLVVLCMLVFVCGVLALNGHHRTCHRLRPAPLLSLIPIS